MDTPKGNNKIIRLTWRKKELLHVGKAANSQVKFSGCLITMIIENISFDRM